jgi:hypothetical protein
MDLSCRKVQSLFTNQSLKLRAPISKLYSDPRILGPEQKIHLFSEMKPAPANPTLISPPPPSHFLEKLSSLPFFMSPAKWSIYFLNGLINPRFV